jgi:pimeloyl-ACP methyl ester carboxylesterase
MDAGGCAFWMPVGPHVVAATLHLPATTPPSGGVLLLPPFGWEETAAHRGLRRWADALARAGFAALRCDWPGTGDSSGELPGGLGTWTATVGAGAEVLRAAGCTRATAIGLGVGGLVAAAALAEGAAVDDLVLWGAPPHGRAATRQLRAASAMLGHGTPEEDDEGTLWVFGYPLPAQLRSDLSELALEDLDLGRPDRRVLVLDRGGDDVVADALRNAAGREAVSVVDGSGYAGLVEHPQTSVLPKLVVAQVTEWLAQKPQGPSASFGPAVTERRWHSPDDFDEELVEVPSGAGRLRAVVTRPASPAPRPLTVLLFNTGATRRTGPGRMWVELARCWARGGVATVRFDLASFGESGGDVATPQDDEAYYAGDNLEQVAAVMDGLPQLGLPSRVVLAGLCSGAYASWHLASRDERVVGAVLLNPIVLDASPLLMATRASRDLRKLVSAAAWRKLVDGRMSLMHAIRVLRASAIRIRRAAAFRAARRRADGAIDAAASRLRGRGTRVAVVFAPAESLLLAWEAAGRLEMFDHPPTMTLHRLEGPADDHTLSARVLARQAKAVLTDVVRELSA